MRREVVARRSAAIPADRLLRYGREKKERLNNLKESAGCMKCTLRLSATMHLTHISVGLGARGVAGAPSPLKRSQGGFPPRARPCKTATVRAHLPEPRGGASGVESKLAGAEPKVRVAVLLSTVRA